MKFKKYKNNPNLDSLFEVYSIRVPDVKKITSEMIKVWFLAKPKLLMII